MYGTVCVVFTGTTISIMQPLLTFTCGYTCPPPTLCQSSVCVCVYVSTPLHQPSVGQRSRCPGQKRYPCICLVCLYAWVAEGVRNWRCPPFCNGTLDKTKTTHFSGPLPHLVFKNKSGLWLQGHDNTSSLPLSPECCEVGGAGGERRGGGEGGGKCVPSLQTAHAIRMQSLSCCKSPPRASLCHSHRRHPSIIPSDFTAIFGWAG